MAHQGILPIAGHDLLIAGLSFSVCGLILSLAARAPRLRGRDDQLRAVQASHVRPTPRLGGLGIFAALATTLPFAPSAISGPYRDFILATGLLFLVGLAEDLRGGIGPRWRLLAAVSASLLAVVLLRVWLPRTGVPGLDAVMGLWWVGVPVTLLVTTGIANGFNLIDGVNGLAGLTAIVAALSLALISHAADYATMVHLATMLAAAVSGFLLWNYPFGRIFLGDGGAYTLGFVLAWFAISILLNAPQATPWAMLLVLFWPVADTLLAIWRRARRKAPTMAPDRLHVHQLVMRTLEIHLLGRGRRHVANPLTTLVLAPFVIAPPVAGVLLWDNGPGAFAAVLLCAVVFFGGYGAAFALLSRRPPRPRAAPQETAPR